MRDRTYGNFAPNAGFGGSRSVDFGSRPIAEGRRTEFAFGVHDEHAIGGEAVHALLTGFPFGGSFSCRQESIKQSIGLGSGFLVG